ncbi:MAG TPA: adenylate/guanylate cyclase domain-containing protein [Actinomycetota bacterium]|nr:adenylate/guanylate cyclase domain-containing protein [Actinomycetota bacterium]
MTCQVCGSPLPEGARFCPNCGAVVGTPLGTEERKMVTVLFADLVDSTGLAQRLDAERAREVLGRFFDAASEELQTLRGRPEKFIGDAVMAVFGLPHVHEDDAVRAVRAGLAIRARTERMSELLGLPQPLEVRIGIESGEAATGLGPAGQLLVTGPVVNAAARLQAAAEPGEVLAGVTTVALTATAVSYGDQRAVAAKGFDTELPCFPVEGLTPRSARRTIPFVGRSSELAILRESLARAGQTGRPVLVTVIGESGIGKSRLADELIAALGDDVPVLTGHTLPFTDTATFAPAATIVAELAGLDEDEPPAKTKRRLRELAERWTPGPDLDRTVERLSLLFGMAERRDESSFVQDVRRGFESLVDGLSSEGPAVLVFEDVHTLTPPMLGLIERLGSPGRDGPRRTLILALARPDLLEERPSWGTSSANAVRLRLEPLSIRESVELARQAAGRRIDDAEADEIARRAGGNPFFIIETTGMLLPGSSGIHASLPPTVQAVVSARIDHQPPRLRELTRRASTFFVSFDLDELRTIDPEVTETELDQLEEAEILVREHDGGPDARWRVRHTTLKDVAYAGLPKRERVRLHQLIADRLLADGHPTWAADHLELAALASLDLDHADRTVADRAADALLGAGNRARRRMENRTAIDRYERALGLAGPEERWGVREARALAGIGEARYWLGEYPAATEVLGRAVDLGRAVGDAFTLALALRFLGDIAINVEADLDKAEVLLDESLAQAEELDDPWSIARTLLFAGWVPWTRDRPEEAEVIWRRALEVADPDDGWARVRALNSLSINKTGGPYDPSPTGRRVLEEALAISEEASSIAERIGDPFSMAITAVQRGRILEDMGKADGAARLEEALAALDGAIPIFEDLGSRWELADAIAERGITKRELGRLDEAEEDLRAAIRISEELGERQMQSWVWRALAVVSEARGDAAEAERRHRRSREAEKQAPR